MPEPSRDRLAYLREHRVISAVWIVCLVGGLAVGPLFMPEEWALLRRLAGGALSGAGIALLLTATKMIG